MNPSFVLLALPDWSIVLSSPELQTFFRRDAFPTFSNRLNYLLCAMFLTRAVCQEMHSQWDLFRKIRPMIGENQQLVTDELVEFEKQLVEVQNFKRIIDHFRGIYGIYVKLI